MFSLSAILLLRQHRIIRQGRLASEFCVRMRPHCRSNTLCIARQCNEMRELNFRKAPQTTSCGVALNPSPLPSDLRAAHCHPQELPFLQNCRQLTVAHSACMCHNLFAVICFSHFHFTTNKKPRRPFRAPRLLVFSGPFCYSPFFYARKPHEIRLFGCSGI